MPRKPIRHQPASLAILFITLCGMAGNAVAQEPADAAAVQRMRRYNVVWTTPSKDASAVMPIGNGDIAAGVYAIKDGDLYLLLAKNDAFTYQGDLFKTGRVRITLSPNPFKAGRPFRQTLDLATGSIGIEADGVTLRIWADANRPVYHVEINAPAEIAVTAQPEFWKRFDHCGFNETQLQLKAEKSPPTPTQDVRLDRDHAILWYFAVGDRSVYPADLKYYHVERMAARFPDPYRFNTFGNLLECPSLSLAGGALSGRGKAFDIRIHACAMQSSDPHAWTERIERQAAQPIDVKRDWQRHCRWWAEFWERGWIVASDRTVPAEAREKFFGEPSPSGLREEEDAAALVAQNYNVFRFLMACQSRGQIQTKFNGGLFTQQLRVPTEKNRSAAVRQKDGTWLTHEDDRLWGRRFTYQNQRLLYWPLLASGDFDLMQPFFHYYANLLEMRKAITEAWFGHGGAYFRENIEPTGAERDCGKDGHPPKTKPGEPHEGWYHDYYFTSGLETLVMMAEYAKYTDDTAFRDHVLVPFAREILLFFDKHYPRGADGRVRLEPAQVLETWWITVNPAPDVAGLRFSLDELLAMRAGTAEDQARWRKLRAETPEVPLRRIEGRQAIAPAEKFEKQRNGENGELYAVFPFRCFGLGLGSGDVVDWTMQHRSCKDAFGGGCWTQDQIGWAYAGRAAEAAAGLVHRFRIASPICRFPLYGREGPDSCPDFDHFGSGSTALQRMLVQEAGDKVLLLPAWPAAWDVDFKLHLAHATVIRGTVKDGKLLTWDIRPAARGKDVVVGSPQTISSAPAIPPNAHPLRAGADQSGHSLFQGRIGRVTMFRGRLGPAAIRDLAAGDRAKPIVGQQVVGCWMNPGAGEALAANAAEFVAAVSFEAWIQPAENEAGRVLDKITAGQHDGFLLDTFPCLSLRLIVGNQQQHFLGALKPGVWQHVAIVINRGTSSVYIDGVRK